jgi:ABC-2 type transport system permease protein
MLRAFGILLANELRLAARSFDMIVFGILFPVGVMFLLGFLSSADALRVDLGGIAAVGICATGLMGLPFAVSEYRHRKVLKRLRVTPAHPALLLAASALTQALFSVVSSTAVLVLARLCFGVGITGPAGVYVAAYLFVLAATYGIGFLVAGLSPNIKTANGVAALLYFPMLFLSGATVPYELFPRGLRAAVEVFPMTQGIKILKAAVLGTGFDSLGIAFVALSAVAVVTYSLGLRFFRWE